MNTTTVVAMNSMKLSKRLKELIKIEDITVAQLSRHTGIPAKTLYKWIDGQSPRKIEQVKKVASFFNITLDELCFGPKEKLNNQLFLKDYEEEILSGNFDVILRRTKK